MSNSDMKTVFPVILIELSFPHQKYSLKTLNFPQRFLENCENQFRSQRQGQRLERSEEGGRREGGGRKPKNDIKLPLSEED